MTVRIPKSRIFPSFEADVAKHAFEMRSWRAHMARVAEDKGKPDLPAIERHVAHPKPDAHPLVATAVNENDVADYAIIDDGQTPEQILAKKKANLMMAVGTAEMSAVALIMPNGKQRLFRTREGDIRMADSNLANELQPTLLTKLASAVGVAKPLDIAAEIESRRPPADTAFLAEQSERMYKIDALYRAASQMLADIEDLTLDNIDAWKMPPFPD